MLCIVSEKTSLKNLYLNKSLNEKREHCMEVRKEQNSSLEMGVRLVGLRGNKAVCLELGGQSGAWRGGQ